MVGCLEERGDVKLEKLELIERLLGFSKGAGDVNEIMEIIEGKRSEITQKHGKPNK